MYVQSEGEGKVRDALERRKFKSISAQYLWPSFPRRSAGSALLRTSLCPRRGLLVASVKVSRQTLVATEWSLTLPRDFTLPLSLC